jgi:hypothetical protein
MASEMLAANANFETILLIKTPISPLLFTVPNPWGKIKAWRVRATVAQFFLFTATLAGGYGASIPTA